MGYYRVNYDLETWSKLSQSFGSLPPLSRAQLYDDALALARAGLLPYPSALNLLSNLATEADSVVLRVAKRGLRFLKSAVKKDPRLGFLTN